MVQKPGKAPGLNHIRPLNLPVPVTVSENQQQLPVSVVLDGGSVKIVSVDDIWQLNDEWWRASPIARLYHRVTTQGGRSITIFRDLVDGGWYRQNA